MNMKIYSVVGRRRIIVNLRNRQPRGTEETHCGDFTGDGVELGDRDGVRDASYHLEAAMHGDKESPVEAALGELYECVDILRTPTNRLRCKSTKLVDVELTSALCKAKIIVDAECAIRHICQRVTCIRLTASVPMNS
jgi:Ni,Fe-hydrogenase III large subunit